LERDRKREEQIKELKQEIKNIKNENKRSDYIKRN